MKSFRFDTVEIKFSDVKKYAILIGKNPSECLAALKKLLSAKQIPEPKIIAVVNPNTNLIDLHMGDGVKNYLRSRPKKSFLSLVETSQPKPTEPPKRHAAGMLIHASDSGRVLLYIDPESNDSPWLANLWGGYCEAGETPPMAAVRHATAQGIEVKSTQLVTLWVDQNQTVIYHNYLFTVPTEFNPSKAIDFIWIDPEQMDQIELHPGVHRLLQNEPRIRELNSGKIDFHRVVDRLLD